MGCWRKHSGLANEKLQPGNTWQQFSGNFRRWYWWPSTRYVDGGGLEGIVGSLASGGVGGVIVMAVIGMIKKARAK